ncbi:hypothetical protein L6452_18081 [Arctium lappa]|uniref:Uncharacterized protein n=1 Tax=Arctium lappa TaxID=4217 RepID=A0ACB9C5H8_ARCLA|nr:hypothetical protein L6452_18081 [Arctium lappa]
MITLLTSLTVSLHFITNLAAIDIIWLTIAFLKFDKSFFRRRSEVVGCCGSGPADVDGLEVAIIVFISYVNALKYSTERGGGLDGAEVERVVTGVHWTDIAVALLGWPLLQSSQGLRTQEQDEGESLEREILENLNA